MLRRLFPLLLFLLLLTSCAPGDLTTPFYAPVIFVGNNQITSPAYGQLYTDDTPSTVTVIVAGDYYLYKPMSLGMVHLTTLNAINGTITINTSGVYQVSISTSSVSNGVLERTVHWAAFLNGTKIPEVCGQATARFGTESVVSTLGLVALALGNVVDLRVTSATAGDVITVDHASLVVNRVGP